EPSGAGKAQGGRLPRGACRLGGGVGQRRKGRAVGWGLLGGERARMGLQDQQRAEEPQGRTHALGTSVGAAGGWDAGSICPPPGGYNGTARAAGAPPASWSAETSAGRPDSRSRSPQAGEHLFPCRAPGGHTYLAIELTEPSAYH